MWNTNQLILDFYTNNWVAIGLLLMGLKGVAILTPSVKDDKIVSLFIEAIEMLKSRRQAPDAPTPKE